MHRRVGGDLLAGGWVPVRLVTTHPNAILPGHLVSLVSCAARGQGWRPAGDGLLETVVVLPLPPRQLDPPPGRPPVMGAPPLRLGLCGLLLLASTPRSHPAAGGSNTADGPHPSSPVGTTPHLRWFSAYDVPAAQCANVSGWMNLHQGDSAEDAALCAKHGVRTLWSVEKLFFNSSVLGHKGCAKVPGGCLVRDWRQAWEKLLPVVAPLVADKTIAVSAAAPSASSEALKKLLHQGFNLGEALPPRAPGAAA